MKKMNFAIIGTNFISKKFVDAINKTNMATAYAVYSRTVEKGNGFAARNKVSKVYTDLELMLLDPDVDAVYVASPTFLHKSHTISALQNGKHVLCEKSIATSFEEFLEMKNACLSSGRVLLEAMRPAFDPSIDALIRSIPKIGKLRLANFEFCKYSSRYENFKRGIVENAFDPTIKNSALSDIGVYPLWLAVRLFGEPHRLTADSIRLSNGFDGAGSVILNYGDMLTKITYSKITEGVNGSYIQGEKGTIIIDKISEPKEIILSLNSGEREIIFSSEIENNMIFEIESFCRMALGEMPFLPYLDVSETLIKTMDRIVASQG